MREWIIFATLFWVIGYLQTRLILSFFEDTLFKPPRWFFILCGLPRSRNISNGYISLKGMVLQLTGMLMVVYNIFVIFKLLPEIPFDRLGMLTSFLFSIFIAFVIYKLWHSRINGKAM